MEAKDSLIDNHMQAELLTDWVCNPFNDTEIERIKNVILDTAQIQAEISFKAGIKEVVEFIIRDGYKIYDAARQPNWCIEQERLDTQLEKWGFTPSTNSDTKP